MTQLEDRLRSTFADADLDATPIPDLAARVTERARRGRRNRRLAAGAAGIVAIAGTAWGVGTITTPGEEAPPAATTTPACSSVHLVSHGAAGPNDAGIDVVLSVENSSPGPCELSVATLSTSVAGGGVEVDGTVDRDVRQDRAVLDRSGRAVVALVVDNWCSPVDAQISLQLGDAEPLVSGPVDLSPSCSTPNRPPTARVTGLSPADVAGPGKRGG